MPEEATPTATTTTNTTTDNMTPQLASAMALAKARQGGASTQGDPTTALIGAALARQSAQGGQGPQDGTAGSMGGPGYPQASLAGNEYHYDPRGQRIIVTHGEHTVNRSAAGVADHGAYADKIHQSLQTRQEAFDKAAAEVSDPRDRRTLAAAHHQVNQKATTWPAAYDHVEGAVNALHADFPTKARVLGHLSTPKFMATWAGNTTP